jgi:hypothetical protein
LVDATTLVLLLSSLSLSRRMAPATDSSSSASGSSSSLLKRTGGTEGFYRRALMMVVASVVLQQSVTPVLQEHKQPSSTLSSTLSSSRPRMLLHILSPYKAAPPSSVARVQWTVSASVDLHPLFYDMGDNNNSIHNSSSLEEGGDRAMRTTAAPASTLLFPGVALALSSTRVLVAHMAQVAMVDAASGELLWTYRMASTIGTAALSGDGEALALTLEPSGVGSSGNAAAEEVDDDDEDDEFEGTGVYTFERDWEDGADLGVAAVPVPPSASAELGAMSSGAGDDDTGIASTTTAAAAAAPRRPGNKPSKASRQRSMGVMYRPSPFLVQNARIAQLAFRGLGHEFSSSSASSGRNPATAGSAGPDAPLLAAASSRRASVSSMTSASESAADKASEGCDLLLVVAGSSAKIYTQNAWRLLLEWTVVPHISRIDFVPGTIAMTLGDLDNVRKPKNRRKAKTGAFASTTPSAASSAPSSRRPSLENCRRRLRRTRARPPHGRCGPSPLPRGGAQVPYSLTGRTAARTSWIPDKLPFVAALEDSTSGDLVHHEDMLQGRYRRRDRSHPCRREGFAHPMGKPGIRPSGRCSVGVRPESRRTTRG